MIDIESPIDIFQSVSVIISPHEKDLLVVL